MGDNTAQPLFPHVLGEMLIVLFVVTYFVFCLRFHVSVELLILQEHVLAVGVICLPGEGTLIYGVFGHDWFRLLGIGLSGLLEQGNQNGESGGVTNR